MIRPCERTEVCIHEEWIRRDPGGAETAFEITAISQGPSGAIVATGRTARGKLIKCQVRQMLTNTERFRFVSDARVREAG